MHYTNDLNLPQPIADAIINDSYDPGKSDITVTTLISPPQKVAIEKAERENIVEDVSDGIYALLGKTVHEILEKANISGVTEERLYAYFKGWCVGGAYDRLVLTPEQTLQDYKVCSVWEYILGTKKEREEQLNCLAHLIRCNYMEKEWPVKLEVVYIFRDWQKSKAKYDKNYPPKQVHVHQVPMWTGPQASDFISSRVIKHQEEQNAPGTHPCTDEERWKDPTKWAVMKPGAKKAIKLHENYEEAVDHVNRDASLEYYLQERPSIPRRCEDYCNAAPFCPQYQSEIRKEAAE